MKRLRQIFHCHGIQEQVYLKNMIPVIIYKIALIRVILISNLVQIIFHKCLFHKLILMDLMLPWFLFFCVITYILKDKFIKE